jgi:uncharacterized membrane protein
MEGFVLVALLVVVGWVLGIVGFFQARRARREVAELRAALAAGRTITAAPDVPMAAAARPSPFGERPAARGSVPAAGPPPMAQADEAFEPPPAEPPPGALPPAGPKLDIEALLTQRWGVWLGAAALVLAGVFLVRYAAEQGMLGPGVRCGLAALLGGGLLAGAEWLRRRPVGPGAVADHAPAGLAAGGVAVLFGAGYAAGALFGLVPAPVGFALMAAAALVGMLASLRFGLLAGLVGVAAAFATPALVETETPFAPGLFAYLLLVTACACAVVRFSAWAGLGWIATVAGAGWVALAATGALGAETWAPGLFVPAAAALHLLLLPRPALDHAVGRRLSWVPMLALGLAGVLLSGAVDDMAVRAGVLLLAPLAVAKAALEPRLGRLPWLAAGLFIAVLLVWAMPAWQPGGEAITIEGAVQAFLPGAWAPAVIRPLLWTAALMAAFFAVSGLFLSVRAANPVSWAGLAAAVPVVTLGVTYLQVARFQPDALWALAAAGLAALSVAATAAAMRGANPGTTSPTAPLQRAGAHAAGAVAALCLGLAIVLHDHWLTLAVALMLPPLAWIAARTDLPALRRVALAVAALVLVRLLGNWYVLDYGFGSTVVVNGLWLAYAVPAACFAVAARMFLRRGDDLTVAVLEAGAIAFATVFVALQIRHAQGSFDADGDLLEAGLHVSALGAQALGGLFLARRAGRKVLAVAWRIQGALGLLGAVLLLVANPVSMDVRAGHAGLLFAYLVPAGLAGVAAMQAELARWHRALGVYALLAGFAWLTLAVRLAFHPGARMGTEPTLDAEMWAYSGVWLGYGVALMAAGIGWAARAVRLAALAVLAVVVAKVFLLDMSALVGLWRVLSFLGLGLALIGLGAVFRRFVVSAAPTPAPETPAAPP